MFWNKSKATWKAAYNLKTNSKFIQIRLLQSLRKDLRALVVKFKTEEHHNFVAYFLAECNAFEGDPRFYWGIAQIYLEKKIEIFEKEIESTNETIWYAKRYLRHSIGIYK